MPTSYNPTWDLGREKKTSLKGGKIASYEILSMDLQRYVINSLRTNCSGDSFVNTSCVCQLCPCQHRQDSVLYGEVHRMTF